MFALLTTAFHDPASVAYKRLHVTIYTLIVVSLLLFGVELRIGDRPLLDAIDLGLLLLFTLELLLRVLTFQPRELQVYDLPAHRRIRVAVVGRLRFLLQPLNLFDLVAVVAIVPALRGLRAFRLLRLIRLADVLPYSRPLAGLGAAFRENAFLYAAALSFLGMMTLIGGTSLYLIESRVNADLATLADGVWWALVTLTTVGFGDIAPITDLGRSVGAVMMVVGMFTLASFAGIVGNTLLNPLMRLRQEQVRMRGTVDHVVVCGYTAGARRLLNALTSELGDGCDVVVFAPSTRPHTLPPEVSWVEGDPTKESELDKARLAQARAVVLVGGRDSAPEQADAVTILTAFTLRRWLKTHPDTRRRKKPLYIVAEILDEENVEHALTAGVNEVIETNYLGFSLLGHALVERGTGRILSSLGVRGEQDLFVWKTPEGLGGQTFAAVAAGMRESMDCLVIGYQVDGVDHVNPPDDAQVPLGSRLVVIAENEA